MSRIKYALLSLVLFCCLALNAENIITLRQAKTLKEEGISAYHEKDYHTAIQNLEQASSAYKHFGKALDYLSCLEVLSLSYEHVGQYDKAIADYTKAIELEPDDLNYKNRADCYKEMKQYEKAIVDYTKAIELNPSLW